MARDGERTERSERGRGGRGRNRGGTRDRAPMDRETQVSKKLSWLLRHGAEKEGLRLGRGGYVGLADVLSNRTIKALQPPPTLSEIQQIVATNAKQRFSLITVADYEAQSAPVPSEPQNTTVSASLPPAASTPTPSATAYLIRANQGHSLTLSASDLSTLLTPLTLSSPALPNQVVHGTHAKIWPTIVHSGGLKPMSRTHIHFASGVPKPLWERFGLGLGPASPAPNRIAASDGPAEGDKATNKVEEAIADTEAQAQAPEIKSGMRHNSTLLIFIDLRKALEAGIEFFVSENGVVLTSGNKHGVLGVEFFERVVEKGGGLLVRDGIVFSTP